MGYKTYNHKSHSVVSQVHNSTQVGCYGRMELDSHADTTVAGANCVVLSYTGRECDVTPYDSSYEPAKGIPIVHAATAWQSPHSGQIYILVLNEALWMPHLPNTLINPNQLRHYGVEVQDNPYSNSPLFIKNEDSSFGMELQTSGTTIFAHTFSPTQQELEDNPHIVLSSPHQWDPHTIEFPKSEKSFPFYMAEDNPDSEPFSISSIKRKLINLPIINKKN